MERLAALVLGPPLDAGAARRARVVVRHGLYLHFHLTSGRLRSFGDRALGLLASALLDWPSGACGYRPLYFGYVDGNPLNTGSTSGFHGLK